MKRRAFLLAAISAPLGAAAPAGKFVTNGFVKPPLIGIRGPILEYCRQDVELLQALHNSYGKLGLLGVGRQAQLRSMILASRPRAC